MELFRVFGSIGVHNSEANEAISETTGKAKQAESKMSSAFKKIGAAVAAGFAVDKIIDFGKQVVKASATVSAEQSAFEQIMGKYSDTATKEMNKVADNTGMVATRLTPYMTSMTAKFKGLGYDISDATGFATRGLSLAADASAFWDMSLDESTSHLNSFINGSYEGGEAIGLFANDTQMAQYAVKTSLIDSTKAWANLDEKTKQATRLEYAENMQKASGAVGQAAKESDQYANVQANLTEKWRQFKAQIGEPILQNIVNPAMDKLSKLVGIASQKFKEAKKWISDNKDKIEKFGNAAKVAGVSVGVLAAAWKGMQFLSWIGQIGGLTAAMNLLTAATWGQIAAKIKDKAETIALTAMYAKDAIVKGVSAIKSGILTTATGLQTAAQWLLNAAMNANPIVLLISAIALLVVGIGALIVKMASEEKAIKSTEDAQKALNKAKKDAKEKEESYIDAIDRSTDAQKALKDAEKETGLSGKELFDQVQDGTLKYENMNQKQREVYKAYLENTEAQKEAKKATKEFTDAKKAETIASFENKLALAAESGNYDDFKKSVVDAFKSGQISADEARDLIGKSMSEMSRSSQKTFSEDLPSDIKDGLDPKKYETSGQKFTKWFGEKWDWIKKKSGETWDKVKSGASSARDKINDKFSDVGQWFGTKFTDAKNKITQKFDDLPNYFKDEWEKIKNTFSNALDKIEGFFKNLKLNFPKIKMPHFKVTGKLSLKPPLSVPKFSVDWYAKAMNNPMLLNKPTIFGANPNGSLLGAGEAGQEVVSGSSTLMNMIQSAVRQENSGISYYLEKLISILANYFPEILEKLEKEIVLDDGTLVGKIAPKIDDKLGDRAKTRLRGM